MEPAKNCGAPFVSFCADFVGMHQHKNQTARFIRSVVPGMNRAALYKNVPFFQRDHSAVVQFHIDFAFEHKPIVHGLGLMQRNAAARFDIHNPEYRAAWRRNADFSQGAVALLRIVGRKPVSRPDCK